MVLCDQAVGHLELPLCLLDIACCGKDPPAGVVCRVAIHRTKDQGGAPSGSGDAPARIIGAGIAKDGAIDQGERTSEIVGDAPTGAARGGIVGNGTVGQRQRSRIIDAASAVAALPAGLQRVVRDQARGDREGAARVVDTSPAAMGFDIASGGVPSDGTAGDGEIGLVLDPPTIAVRSSIVRDRARGDGHGPTEIVDAPSRTDRAAIAGEEAAGEMEAALIVDSSAAGAIRGILRDRTLRHARCGPLAAIVDDATSRVLGDAAAHQGKLSFIVNAARATRARVAGHGAVR